MQTRQGSVHAKERKKGGNYYWEGVAGDARLYFRPCVLRGIVRDDDAAAAFSL